MRNYHKEYLDLIENVQGIDDFVEATIITKPESLPELLKTQRQLAVLNAERTKTLLREKTLKLETYSPEMTHKIRNYYFCYKPKNKSKDNIYFNHNGMVKEYEDYAGEHKLVLHKKNEKLQIPIGYNLQRGLLVYGEYRVTMDAAETSLIKTLYGFYVINAFNINESFRLDISGKIDKRNVKFNDFNNWMLPKFFNEFYGVTSIQDNVTPSQLIKAKNTCDNFELIIKTAPQWIINLMFKSNRLRALEKVNHLSTIFNLNKKIYKEYKNDPNNLFYISWLMNTNKLTEGKALKIMKQFNNLYEELLLYSKDLGNNGDNLPTEIKQFVYNSENYRSNTILYGWDEEKASMFNTLIVGYFKSKVIKKHYTIDKYLSYAQNAIINQGFMSVKAFTTLLYDYLDANNNDNYNPVDEPDYLRRVHDVYAANRIIIVTQEMEVQFMSQYVNDEDWTRTLEKGEKKEDLTFFMTTPKKSKDLKIEGNQLSHCVGGYIPRVCEGKTKIYFLRRLAYPQESFITVEVKDGILSQASGLTNRSVNGNIKAILKLWAKDRKFKFSI